MSLQHQIGQQVTSQAADSIRATQRELVEVLGPLLRDSSQLAAYGVNDTVTARRNQFLKNAMRNEPGHVTRNAMRRQQPLEGMIFGNGLTNLTNNQPIMVIPTSEDVTDIVAHSEGEAGITNKEDFHSE